MLNGVVDVRKSEEGHPIALPVTVRSRNVGSYGKPSSRSPTSRGDRELLVMTLEDWTGLAQGSPCNWSRSRNLRRPRCLRVHTHQDRAVQLDVCTGRPYRPDSTHTAGGPTGPWQGGS